MPGPAAWKGGQDSGRMQGAPATPAQRWGSRVDLRGAAEPPPVWFEFLEQWRVTESPPHPDPPAPAGWRSRPSAAAATGAAQGAAGPSAQARGRPSCSRCWSHRRGSRALGSHAPGQLGPGDRPRDCPPTNLPPPRTSSPPALGSRRGSSMPVPLKPAPPVLPLRPYSVHAPHSFLSAHN